MATKTFNIYKLSSVSPRMDAYIFRNLGAAYWGERKFNEGKLRDDFFTEKETRNMNADRLPSLKFRDPNFARFRLCSHGLIPDRLGPKTDRMDFTFI